VPYIENLLIYLPLVSSKVKNTPLFEAKAFAADGAVLVEVKLVKTINYWSLF